MSKITNQISCTSILTGTCTIVYMHFFTSLPIPEHSQLTITDTSSRGCWTTATCADRWTSEIDCCITLKVILAADGIGSLE